MAHKRNVVIRLAALKVVQPTAKYPDVHAARLAGFLEALKLIYGEQEAERLDLEAKKRLGWINTVLEA